MEKKKKEEKVSKKEKGSKIYDQNMGNSKKRERIDLKGSELKKKEREEGSDEENEGEKGKAVKKVKPDVNPWNGKTYSKRYYEILEKRKKLPA